MTNVLEEILKDMLLFAFRPLSGKQKINHLCDLCASNERSEWPVNMPNNIVLTASTTFQRDPVASMASIRWSTGGWE